MQAIEQIDLKEFELGFKFVEPVVKQYLSAQYDGRLIAINRLPFLNQKIVCPYDEANQNHITIMEYLKLCVYRWHQEIQYQNEILLLKEQIIKVFDKFCDGIEEEELILIIKTNRQSVIELLFKLCEFDHKQLAGNFCKGLKNGFETEILNKFEDYAIYVLLKPFVTALPVGLFEYMEEILKLSHAVINAENIKWFTSKIIRFMEEKFEINLIETNKIESNEALQNKIEKSIEARNKVSVVSDQPIIFESVLNKYRTNISFIKLQIKVSTFMKEKISLLFDEVAFEYFDTGILNKECISKLPKTLKKLTLDFRSLGEWKKVDIEQCSLSMSEIPSYVKIIFDLRNHPFSPENVSALAKLIEQAECKIKILAKNFSYENSRATDKEMKEIMIVLANSKELETFCINCSGCEHNNITEDGVKFIANILTKNKNLTSLQVNLSNQLRYYVDDMTGDDQSIFGQNSVNDQAIYCLSTALNDMTELSKLSLDFSNYYYSWNHLMPHEYWMQKKGDNSITDKGIHYLRDALLLKKNIDFEMRVFGYNNNVTMAGSELLESGDQFSKFDFQYEFKH